MKQILHIFQKDTRRFWPEILLSLVIVLLYVIHFPSEWRVYGDQAHRQMLQQITNALSILMPVSWWLLIARSTHAEPLVGDNEFWLTRPYEWKKLLAAKVVFLAVWICVPYLLAQACMLVAAGFQPTSYIPGIFTNLFLISAILILPLFSIAAVNANFARMTLTLLGILCLYIAIMFFASTTTGDSTSNPYRDVIALPLVFCVCAAAIVLQYATRRVWLSRTLLMAIPILVLVVGYVYNRQSLVDRAYPRPSSASTSPVLMALAPDTNHPIKARSSRGQDYIDLRVQYSGVPEGYAVFSDNVKFTFIAADGQQWTSPWQQNDDHILPGIRYATLSLMLSPDVYDRFKSGPVTLRLTSALTRLQAGMVTAVEFPSKDVPVAGHGFCSSSFESGSNLACRSAITQPHLAHVTALWTNGSCSAALPGDTVLGSAWTGTISPSGVSFPMSSVMTQNLWFNNTKAREGFNGYYEGWNLCPGTPLTFTQYNVVDRTKSDVTIPDFHLPAIEVTR